MASYRWNLYNIPMKPYPRLFPILLLVLVLQPAGCTAQIIDAERQVADAELAAPEQLRGGAHIYGYDDAGGLVTIREGTNDLTCLADQPGDGRFHVACYHNSLEPYMARGRELRAEGIQGQESFERRHKEAEAGTLAMPTAPAAVYNVVIDSTEFDRSEARVALYALYVPYATQASTGIPERPEAPGGPWIMRPGTPSAHIMISPPVAE